MAACDQSPALQSYTSLAYWNLQEGVPVYLIDTEAGLLDVWPRVAGCCLCAFDAECASHPPPVATGMAVSSRRQRWKPDSSKPKATLVQLACRAPDGSTSVYLLDMMALDGHLLKDLLQALLRRWATVKIGFGVVPDLLAIAAALGKEGGGCVARANSLVDVRLLHRGLQSLGAPVPATSGNGLSGMVAAVLGKPLNKSQQCSEWHLRPLSPEQILYGANDAAVLLALFDAFVAASPPEKFTVVRLPPGAQSTNHHSQPDTPPARTSDDQEGSNAGQGSKNGGNTLRSRTAAVGGRLGSGRPAVSPRRQVHASAEPDGRADVPSHPLAMSALQSVDAVSDTEVATGLAATNWGNSMQQESGRFSWVFPHVAGSESSKRSQGPGALPAYIPWVHGHTRDKTFLCDVMLEGLARQMRLFGIDATSSPQLKKQQRALGIRSMLTTGLTEQRVVLTGDRIVPRASNSQHVYLVKATNKKEQLAEIVQAFRIDLDTSNIMSRCNDCAGDLMDRTFRGDELPPECGVPTGVLRAHDMFWVCSSCKKVFWQGTQYESAMQHLSARLKHLNCKT